MKFNIKDTTVGYEIPVVAKNRTALVKALKSFLVNITNKPLEDILTIVCSKCNENNSFKVMKEIPKKNYSCKCGQLLIKYDSKAFDDEK